MKYTKININSARKNPKLNPKVSVIDELLPYKTNSRAFITYTTVNKVGINPSSTFNTPLGIYAYPLRSFWENIANDTVPFAGGRPYVSLLLVKKNAKILNNNYSWNDNDQDQVKLYKFCEEKKLVKSNKGFVRLRDDAYEKYPFESRKPVFYIWALTRYIAYLLNPNEEDSISHITKWSSIFNKVLGYDGAIDFRGWGFIHPNEPKQAVFFTKKAIKHVATFDNKRYEEYSRNISGLYSSDTSKEILDFFKKEGNITVEKLRGSNIILSKGELKGKTVPLFVSGTILSNIYNSIIGEKKEKDKINSYKDYMTKLENNRSSEYSLFINPSNSHISNVVKNCLIQDGNFGSTCKISNCIIEGGFITGEFKNCKITNCSLYYNELAFINVSGVTDSYWFIDNLNYYRRKAYNKAERELPFNKMVKKLGGTEYEKQRANIIYNIILEEMRKYFSIESIIYTTGRAIFK